MNKIKMIKLLKIELNEIKTDLREMKKYLIYPFVEMVEPLLN